jgi:hypothetical protein
MIQRIQTLYLLAIAILSCLVFFLPTANFLNLEYNILFQLDYQGVAGENNMSTWSLKIISGIIPIIALITTFLYKQRATQIRLSITNMFLMLGFYVIFFMTVIQTANATNSEWSLNVPAAFPLVCLILNWLAIRAIGKDIALLKSLSRLR